MRLPFVLALLAGLLGAAPSPEIHEYLETTGDRETGFRWTLHRGEGEWRIESHAEDETHVVFCQPDGNTRKWTLEREGTRVVATRQGQTLTIAGTVEGKPYRRTVRLGQDPWLQALSLALRVQVAENIPEQVFWMVRPDNFDPIRLRAETEGREVLALGGTRTETRRVRVGKPGRMTALWYSHYWFRTEDFVFARYEGVFGLPFVPRTVIVLRNAANGP